MVDFDRAKDGETCGDEQIGNLTLSHEKLSSNNIHMQVLLPSSEQLSAQYKDMMDSTDYSYDGSREWPGIVRKVQRQAPDYNT